MNVCGITLRAAQMMQPKNDVRYYLNGVFLGANGDIVATDGHTLFYAPSSFEAGQIEDTIINIEGLIPKNVETAFFDFERKVIIAGKKTLPFTVIEGKFPDYNRVIPKEDAPDSFYIHIAPKYLKKVHDVYGDYGVLMVPTGNYTAPIRVTSPGHPILNKTQTIIMPVLLFSKGDKGATELEDRIERTMHEFISRADIKRRKVA